MMASASPADQKSAMQLTNSPAAALSQQEMANIKPSDELYKRKLEDLKYYQPMLQRILNKQQPDPST